MALPYYIPGVIIPGMKMVSLLGGKIMEKDVHETARKALENTIKEEENKKNEETKNVTH
jgi:hypothetical protein